MDFHSRWENYKFLIGLNKISYISLKKNLTLDTEVCGETVVKFLAVRPNYG